VIDCLVFSKDRAAQLDLLLRSIRRHAPSLYQSLTVLYTGSSADYLRGYQVCFAEHEEAKFILEHDFEVQTRLWLDFEMIDYVSFLVDDDVFYRDVPDIDFEIPCSLRGGDYDYPFSVDGNIYRRRGVQLLLEGLRFRDPTETRSECAQRPRQAPIHERVSSAAAVPGGSAREPGFRIVGDAAHGRRPADAQ